MLHSVSCFPLLCRLLRPAPLFTGACSIAPVCCLPAILRLFRLSLVKFSVFVWRCPRLRKRVPRRAPHLPLSLAARTAGTPVLFTLFHCAHRTVSPSSPHCMCVCVDAESSGYHFQIFGRIIGGMPGLGSHWTTTQPTACTHMRRTALIA